MEQKKTPVNYLYFGAAFLFLLILISSSIFTRESLGGSQFFFFFYALGQLIMEMALFIFLIPLIRDRFGKIAFGLFIGVTFTALVIHFFDYIMDRVLDLSIWQVVKIFVFDENWSNFFYLLDASGIPIWGWIIFFSSLTLIPFMGMFVYYLSNRLSEKKPIYLKNSFFLQAFICIPCALFFWDFSASKVIHPNAYTAFIKSLPWKSTFIHPETILLSHSGSLRPPKTEEHLTDLINRDTTHLSKRPNIYLFVVESLREDAITPEIAPNLYAFKNEYTHFHHAASNGNGTNLSWFSIFHSQFAFHWQNVQKKWKMGSPALALLKKWGYKIRLYTSAQLGYYGMEKLLFGQHGQLLDSRQTFHHAPPLSAADADASAIASLKKDLQDNPSLQEGQVFLIFLDATHFNYSWPKNWSPKFTPFAQELAYFRAFQSQKNIGAIKNRYHNAVNFVDHLFGDFFNNLPNREEALIVFTGDHGEEFFEHGHLFHNSHLSRQQTNVPLYFKLGNHERVIYPHLVGSQMDIFPTLIDYLAGAPPAFLEGNSLLQKSTWPYAITARFNAGRTPYEFAIHNGKNKLIAQFSRRKNILASKQLRIISLRTADDKTVYEFKNDMKGWIDAEFGPAISRLFDN